ncbi:hypothetical protein GpartN1_g5574.t1 [Galdieria partita]|uniref:Uncharacterized protein n=1 Tax=Galdieria partita TaxID=83374 RepID=A0A9C7PZI6_9RHOD|nr:hypothetical protein GpartN1_g5574.t1 [Galdieria partita]
MFTNSVILVIDSIWMVRVPCFYTRPTLYIIFCPKYPFHKVSIQRFGFYVSRCCVEPDGLRTRGEEVDKRRREWILQRRELRNTIDEEQWNQLIWKFEQRARITGQSDHFQSENGYSLGDIDETKLGKRASPPLSIAPPVIETGLCVAAVRTFLFVSRVARWKDFFSIAGPIPIVYISLRWGPRYSCLALCLLICFFVLRPGPLYCLQYTLTQGLAIGVLTHTMWWQWNWFFCILSSATAYLFGIIFEISLTSFVLGKNTWTLITQQSVQLFIRWFPFVRSQMNNSSGFWVKVAILVFLFIHSLVHVVSVYIPCTLFLSAVAVRMNLLSRKPSLLPGLQKLVDQLDKSGDRHL